MSSLKIILLGFLRHTIGIFGMWLVARGYLGAEARDAWVGKAVEEAFGAVLMGGAYLWSAIDKKLVIDWLRRALHMMPPVNTSERSAAKRISPLVTAPGTAKLPTALVCLLVFVVGCSSGGLVDLGLSGDATSTIYRSPDNARTALTALEALRYNTAQAVAKAYLTGRITKEQSDQYRRIDDDFRAAWATAADYVQLWQSTKGAPPKLLQESMNALEFEAAKIEERGRQIQ